MVEDFERCYRALKSRDSRFDGWFFAAVTSTRIYCRPSCPALTPKRENVRFFPTAAAAQSAGFRSCKRCRPDVTPGSPEWNPRDDIVARAMRLIADGLVDRDGVAGLARRLHFSERHLHRILRNSVGAGPQALARAQRAETARLLIETTELPVTEVAFAAGFGSVRQFNDTVRAVFAASPTDLRRRRRQAPRAPGAISLRLPYREPLDGAGLLSFLGARSVPGVEEFTGGVYRRTLGLPHGEGVVELALENGHVRCVLRLQDLRDLGAAVQRCRRLLDLDADPVAVDEVLSADRRLRPLVAAAPGKRIPGAVDGAELAARAVLGQQISTRAARTLAGRLAASYGKPLTAMDGTLTHLWPEPHVLAAATVESLSLPRTRGATLKEVARMLAEGELVLDPGADRAAVERTLLATRGIGRWSASYIAMRALGDCDAFLPTDAGVRRAFERLGLVSERDRITDRARRWRPWRAYALQYLWSSA